MEHPTTLYPQEELARVTIDGTSRQSVAIGADSALKAGKPVRVRLFPTVPCCIKVGADPEATGNDTMLAAESFEVIDVPPGWKIAVIRRGDLDGTLGLTIMAKAG